MIIGLSLKRLIQHKYFVLICFVIFIVLRVSLIFSIPLQMGSDALWYLYRGISIASGYGYSEDGNPTAYWPVGYPGFLGIAFWLFGKDPLTGQIANLLLASGIFFLVLNLGRLIFSEDTARISVFLLAIYPNNIGYTATLLSELFFTFLILLGLYIHIARKSIIWTATSGLIFGFSALTKPQFIFLPAILLFLEYIQKRKTEKILFSLKNAATRGLIIYSMMAIVLIPWSVRNYIIFKDLVLISTNGGATLLTGNNPSASGGFTPDDPLISKARFSVADQVASDRRAKKLAIEWIKNNPVRFMELIPLKIWHLWHKDGEIEWEYQRGYSNYDKHKIAFRIVRVVNQLFYMILIILMVRSIFVPARRRVIAYEPWSWFGYIFIIYISLISTVFSGQPRFHFPVMPWIIMYASLFLTVKTDVNV